MNDSLLVKKQFYFQANSHLCSQLLGYIYLALSTYFITIEFVALIIGMQ